ncbi:MAG: hypothetical protein DRH08_12250, partial [Deltaproteobacteria bacterium]
MAKQSTKAVKFPIKGLERRWGFQGQGPFSTVDCVNVWPTDWTTGRERGCTRPKLVSATDISAGEPSNWCEAAWQKVPGGSEAGGSIHVGVAVAGKNGVMLVSRDKSDVKFSTTGSFNSCAVYLQRLFAVAGTAEVSAVNLSDDDALNVANPLIADYVDDTEEDGVIVDDTRKGTVPTNCTLVQTWGDRLVLAGDTENPMVIYM